MNLVIGEVSLDIEAIVTATANKRATLMIAEDDNTLENCFYLEKIDNNIIFQALTEILATPDFLLPNTNWLPLKILLMAIIPFAASVNNLGITTILAIPAIGLTCFLGMNFLVDISRVVVYLVNKAKNVTCKMYIHKTFQSACF